jgi:hypothetical protein
MLTPVVGLMSWIVSRRASCSGAITPPFPWAGQGPNRADSPQPWMLGCRL